VSRPGPGGVSFELAGTIASAGFSSGHRFVVGHWADSPLGPMDDVMCARPDGTRVLLADRREVAQLITAVYRFDVVEVVPVRYAMDEDVLTVAAGDLCLTLRTGRRWPIPLAGLRRHRIARPVEGLAARALLGVRTWGVSPSGVWEWYRADEYRRVVTGEARLAGRDLGRLRPFHEPAGFGFSEPPRHPSVVRVQPLLHDPSGRLAAVVGTGARPAADQGHHGTNARSEAPGR
jgi:hypothetical protein